MWLAENEGAKFWLNVLTELKNRGLQGILIAYVEGLQSSYQRTEGGSRPRQRMRR
jgi:transposase-like protein